MAIGKIIGQGRTADIHEFDQDKIVKLFHDKTPEDWVDYEYKINLVANQFGCSVPKIHEKTLIDGRYGLVFDYIEGDLVTDLLKKPFQNPKHIAMHTASAHAKVNAVAFGSSGHPFDENSIVLSRQYDYFTKKIKASDALSPEEKDDVIHYLLRLPDGLRLCHGDLHTDNYIVSGSKYFIIDWTNAYVGHPAGDVARSILLMQTPYGKKDVPGLLKPFASLTISNYMRSFLKVYMSISDLKQHEIDAWMLPVAAARLSENIPHEREWLLALIKDELHKHRPH